MDFKAYICRKTGKIYWESDVEDEEFPEDIDDFELYVQIPSQAELGLGKPLVLSFAAEKVPEHYEKIERIFCKRGAYRRFKIFLESVGLLENWFEYERAAIKRELSSWAKGEGFSVND